MLIRTSPAVARGSSIDKWGHGVQISPETKSTVTRPLDFVIHPFLPRVADLAPRTVLGRKSR